MRTSVTFPSPRLIRLVCLLAFASPSVALAQTPDRAAEDSANAGVTDTSGTSDAPSPGDGVGNSAASATPKAATSTAPKAATIAQPVAVAPAKVDEPSYASVAGVGVERVPASGYPTYKTRGLYGGSLWLTFHGLQWPYMPMRAGEPKLMLGLSGSGWVDTGYEKVRTGKAGDSDLKYLVQQGRFVLRATPTYRIGDWFVQGQAELVANNDQTQTQAQGVPSADDVWIRAGKWNTFDIQAGRFEAWELYHLGMGLDLNTLERHGANNPYSVDNGKPPDFYGVTYAYYRPSGAGNVAAHFYLTDFLRVEALTSWQ